jgi:hypothetical protein
MSDVSSDSRGTGIRPQVVGGVVGAILGTVGRLAVAVSFLIYVSNWGGPFFRNEGRVNTTGLFVSLISAGFGLVAGGIGGCTCRPLMGAAIGGSLSGMFCLGLFVLPINVLISMSGGGAIDYSEDKAAITTGLLAMTLVGVIAGGLGAAVGKHRKNKTEQSGT